MNVPALRHALKAGALRELDVYFAERITRNLESGRDDVALAAAMVSHAVGEGDVCVDLAQQSGQSILANENFAGAYGTQIMGRLAEHIPQIRNSRSPRRSRRPPGRGCDPSTCF